MKRLDQYWYSQNPIAWSLLPLAALFCGLVTVRRVLYRTGILKSHFARVPVIVVGNISVGGTGKTPLIVHLCNWLQSQGYRPGVVSRGYGGQSDVYPLMVDANSQAARVGDEPLLIALRTECPVVVGPDRMEDIEHMLGHGDVDVILADDGMQHYRMHRDAEIAVVDARREFGNGYCLPAGPLREPRSRLRSVDMVISNGGDDTRPSFQVITERAMAVSDYGVRDKNGGRRLQAFSGQTVHAVAGIGHPQRFFDTLRQRGIECIEHVYPDHHMYDSAELEFGDDLPVFMTEKDAVKCREFDLHDHWYVPIDIRLSESARQGVQQIVQQVCNG